jgi:hypothetical protein
MSTDKSPKKAPQWTLFLAASLAFVGVNFPSSAQDAVSPDYAFYKGKVLNIMVANAAGTTLGNSIVALKEPLEKALGAEVRINYNTSPAVAAMNAGASQTADGLNLGAMSIPVATANAIFDQPLAFSLTDLSWVGATSNFVFGAFACGPTPVWNTFDEFVNSAVPVKTTGVYGGSGYLLDIGLLRAIGIQYEMLTGYTSKDIGLSCTRGDGNFHVGSTLLYVNSAGTALVPGARLLLLSGKVPTGASMEFMNSLAPTFDEWLKTHSPKTDAERELLALVSAMFAVESPTQGLYAPKGVPAERVAALREAFAKAAADPSAQAA